MEQHCSPVGLGHMLGTTGSWLKSTGGQLGRDRGRVEGCGSVLGEQTGRGLRRQLEGIRVSDNDLSDAAVAAADWCSLSSSLTGDCGGAASVEQDYDHLWKQEKNKTNENKPNRDYSEK